MKKSSFLLSVILVFCLAFLTSCSSIFDSNNSGATVSFRLNQDAVNALASKVSSSRAGIPAELADTTLSVTLYVNNKPVTQETPLTEEGAFISFPNIIVGSKVSALVKILKNGELLAAGTSGEAVRVKKGENLLSVTLRYAADGQIFFGDHVTIQLASSSDEIWLNQGDWTIKLLDDEGNDILADVDWEARDESEPNNPLINDYLISVVPSVVKGHTSLVGESDYLSYFSIENNKLSLKQNRPLSQSGTLELTVTIQPGSETYMNKSGKSVPFPQFEPVSTTLELNVKNTAGINMSNYGSRDTYADELSSVLNACASGTKLAFYGTTAMEYDDDVLAILKSKITETHRIFDIDMSDLRSTATDKKIDFVEYRFGDFSYLSAFAFPDDLEEIGTQQFQNCSNLQSIKLGSSTKKLGNDAFAGCSSLTEVIIPANCQLEIMEDSAFGSTGLTQFTIPKTVIALGTNLFYNTSVNVTFEDPSGQWYSISSYEIFYNWLSGDITSVESNGTVVSDITAVNFINNDLYYYCIK